MTKEKFKNIICFGEVLWDMLPSGSQPGGAPLNVAIHLIKHRLNPTLISKIGNDSDGERLDEFLLESGVNTDFIQKDNDLPTSKVLIHLDENKNANYEICEPVAWDNIQFNDEILQAAKNADLIIFGSLASRNLTSRNTLLQILNFSSAVRLVDINLRSPYDDREWIEELLHLSDFAKLNDDELFKIAGWNQKTGTEKELIKWFSEFFNCRTVCLIRGKNGAFLYTGSKLFIHRGYKIVAADTVGAGDSFLASLVVNLSKNLDPEKALEIANATGAFVASQNGAVPNYSATDIKRIINADN